MFCKRTIFFSKFQIFHRKNAFSALFHALLTKNQLQIMLKNQVTGIRANHIPTKSPDSAY